MTRILQLAGLYRPASAPRAPAPRAVDAAVARHQTAVARIRQIKTEAANALDEMMNDLGSER